MGRNGHERTRDRVDAVSLTLLPNFVLVPHLRDFETDTIGYRLY